MNGYSKSPAKTFSIILAALNQKNLMGIFPLIFIIAGLFVFLGLMIASNANRKKKKM